MHIKRIAALLLVLLVITGTASAREILNQDDCHVAANQTVQGNLFVMCRVLSIEGAVTGNLIGVAADTLIDGSIAGDVYLLGSTLRISGVIGEDVHFAGGVLNILSSARFDGEHADLYAATISSTIARGTTIPGSTIGLGYQLLVEGSVGGEMAFWGSTLEVRGDVAGDIDATVGGGDSASIAQLRAVFAPLNVELHDPGLIIGEAAQVGGTLRYSAPQPGQIDGTLANPVVFDEISVPSLDAIELEAESAGRTFNVYVASVINEFTTLSLIGVIGLLFAPSALQMPIRSIQLRPLPSLAVGMLAFLLSFVIFIVLFGLSLLLLLIFVLLRLNDLALALGIMLGIVDVGSASMFYFAAIFVSRVILSLTIGRFLVRAFGGLYDNSTRTTFYSLFAGVAALALLASLPVFGVLINAFAMFVGLGAMLSVLMAQLRSLRETPPPVITAGDAFTAPALKAPPPPTWEQVSSAPGMDNLPNGFKWWDD